MGLFFKPNIQKLKARGNIRKLIKALVFKRFEDVRRGAAVPHLSYVLDWAGRSDVQLSSAEKVDALEL